MDAAKRSISSTLHKNEKALESMKAKNPKQWQLDRITGAIAHHRTMLAILEGQTISREQLEETLSAIPGYIQKIQTILPRFAPGTPQHTLAVRRIAAYELAAEQVRKHPTLASDVRATHKARARPRPTETGGTKMNMIRITIMGRTEYPDLMKKYENPIDHPCDILEGQVFLAVDGQKPRGLCDSAWETMAPFVRELAAGGGNFFDGWMKDPRSAMISCNDGFRPVSFYIEVVE